MLAKLSRNSNTVFGLLNVFLGRRAFAFGDLPAEHRCRTSRRSIIIQLLTRAAHLEALRKEGESGRQQT